MEHPEYTNVEGAAKRLGISPRRVRKLCMEDRLGEKVLGRYLIKVEELEEFAQQERVPGRPKTS